MDGEAWIQPPGIIRILHKNRMQMLGRNRALENSLKSWEEKQRQSIAGQGGAKPRLSISGASHDKSRSSVTRQSMPGHTTETSKSFLGVTVEKIRQHSFSGAVSDGRSYEVEIMGDYCRFPTSRRRNIPSLSWNALQSAWTWTFCLEKRNTTCC